MRSVAIIALLSFLLIAVGCEKTIKDVRTNQPGPVLASAER